MKRHDESAEQIDHSSVRADQCSEQVTPSYSVMNVLSHIAYRSYSGFGKTFFPAWAWRSSPLW
ncbi:hypothetical protein K523DRAFT_322548 [Schizophyllum commune Tattone D]|nr:hypothetical protein K523DRAFT_322548 [Schizophyllum commune Tattone D]